MTPEGQIEKLSGKLFELEYQARGRALTRDEAALAAEMRGGIEELKKQLPANAPLTLQGPGRGQSALTDRHFAIDADGKVLPILARGERLTSRFPRPKGENGEWSIGDFVRASMGIPTIRATAVVERGTGVVPQFVSNQIIDLVREKARIIQAGAITIPIQGVTHLCRVASDPTVLEHAEGVDDITESYPVFEPVVLDPKMLVARIPLSVEVVQDSPNLDAALNATISGAFASKLDALTVAKLIADTDIPDSASGQSCATWAGVLTAVEAALALDQDLPKARISGTVDYIARVAELGTANGNWLGAPAALQGMADLFSGGMTDGTAIFGDFSRGVGIAVRSELTLELIRWGKPGFGSHVLMAYARMAGYVLQPAVLFKQLTTVA